jgi:glutamine cyclotransferase
MKKYLALILICTIVASCKREDKKSFFFASPSQGVSIASGKTIILKLDTEPGSFDSIRYYLDAKFVGTKNDTSALSISSDGLPFGARLVSAQVFTGKDSAEVTTNIQLLPATAPPIYGYTVVNTYPHDTTSFTEGLEYHDGFLYESDGGTIALDLGKSSLRKVILNTGKVVKNLDIDNYFAEGITVVDDKIIQITYKEKLGLVFDKNTFKKISEFNYSSPTGEGWGLAFNGTHILNTDGSNSIYLLNKDTFQKEGEIAVYDNTGPVSQLNEIEYIDGKIYSNIWQKELIAIIDPKNGSVEAYIDLKGILADKDRVPYITDVLNGIAYDTKGKRLFVTGKKWNKLFEIKIKKG